MEMTNRKLILLILQLILVNEAFTVPCNRKPPGVKTPGSGGFLIEIAGNPSSYKPRQKYQVKLRSLEENEHHRFVNFILLVENGDYSDYDNGNGDRDAGSLHILGNALTTYHDRCPNAIMQTNTIQKSEIEVLWVAPPERIGCVVFKATVVVSKEIWYMDDGLLSLQLCETSPDVDSIEPPILDKCCACHEAKYEVTFESLWSRNTHPKDFPPNNFITKFSDIIGATHSVDYKFWSYGGYASDGLKVLAEQGNTKLLETELKDKSDQIRTIIKARGISYPNITGKTFAVFRVDDRHHLMSLVSMLHPSPDWIVGVSSLELCQFNCSWIESKTLNLYPWDAGTDNGTTYLSEDSPIYPREPIRRITSQSPENSPFYDENGQDMKPLARLILSRQRLYEKHNCENPDNSREISDLDEYCAVTEWDEWTTCNAKCGRGTKYRQRTYKYKAKDQHKQTETCKQTLTQRSSCHGDQPECHSNKPSREECELTPWGQWSACSVTCGNGTITRSRRYHSRTAAKHCRQVTNHHPKLEENLPCEMPPCNWTKPIPAECEDLAWSEWSVCSVTCGKGTKIRRKLPIRNVDLEKHNRISRSFDDESEEAEPEDICEQVTERVECRNDENPFCDESAITDNPSGETSNDCVVSKWSHWSPCSASCGKGIKIKRRRVLHPAGPGGKPCPDNLVRKKKCRVHCSSVPDVDCIVSEWSSWSPCNLSCGPNAVQQRTRIIDQEPSGNGRPCPERVQYKPCNLSVCPD